MSKGDFRFHTSLQVRWMECDAQRIVYNGSYLDYLELGQAGYYHNLGFSIYKVAERGYFDIALVKVTLEFKAPARVEDMLDICVMVTRVGNTSITMDMEIYAQDTDRMLTTGQSIYVGYDVAKGATRPVPPEIRDLIDHYERTGIVLPLERFPELATVVASSQARTPDEDPPWKCYNRDDKAGLLPEGGKEAVMRVGVIFPQTEIGADPVAVRDYVQAVEDLGYAHLSIFDHVLGADTQFYRDWSRVYTSKDMFHEPFVVFGFMAAITKRLELVTSVVVLGQRQTALVAKQAAEVDVLTGGRLRLGIGTGWNHVEYEALGESFNNRGRRSEEQIALLRALWTQDVIDFKGRWHRVTHAGLNPLPVQRPIPIWLGGGAEAVVRRVARIADGWFPQFSPDDEGREILDRMRGYARQAGRDPSTIGIEPRIEIAGGTPDSWAKLAKAWEGLGATHISVNTMKAGLGSPEEHINAIRQFKEAVDS